MSDLVAQIVETHRERNFIMAQRQRLSSGLLAFLRADLGYYQEGLTKPQKTKIEARAKELVEIGDLEVADQEFEAGLRKRRVVRKARELDRAGYDERRIMIITSLQGLRPFASVEDAATRRLSDLAEQLPVWPWFQENVFKNEARQLGVIVGEAGDLSRYATHSKLWKRMGVAVMDGKRQGGLTKGASKEEWIAHGYNSTRRAKLFVIGDILVKQAGNQYRAVYLKRKDAERLKAQAEGLTVAPSAKIPKSRAAEFRSDGHIDKRARRYMEKRLLRDLWQAWRKAGLAVPEKAIHELPSAENIAATAARDGEVAISPLPPNAATEFVPSSPPDTQAGQLEVAADGGQSEDAGLGSPIAGHVGRASFDAEDPLPATPTRRRKAA